MSAPDPNYDLQTALELLAPGYLVTHEMLDAAAAQYATNGFTPLTSGQAQAVALASAEAVEAAYEALLPPGADVYPDPLPPQYPTGMPRLPDSNEATDGWTICGASC